MKKTVKIFLIFVFALIIFSLGDNVQANSIREIYMSIDIDSNGDARITETWKCYVTEGTEVYHPYYNLGNSEIKDLVVSDGISTYYTTLPYWNTSGTLDSKANKCGINKISDGVEICWGISNYGSHEYTVRYTITNFVSELTDSQMIYWTLIPHNFSTKIKDVSIYIHTDFAIPDTTDVWGYGNYGGTAYVHNGRIFMRSDGALSTDEYMTILVKLPQGTFNTTNKLNNDFNYYYEMAEDGAIKYEEDSESSLDSFFWIMEIIFIAIAAFTPFVIAMKKEIENTAVTFKFGSEGKKIPKDVPYYRDIPCKKDVFRAYYIGHQYGLLKNKTDLLGAIILKWLKDGLIKIKQKETGVIFKKENTVVVLNKTDLEILTDEKEKELFKMLYEASKDGYLENKEFESWCSISYSTILSWFDDIIKRERQKLVEEGLINLEEKVALKICKQNIYTATPELKQEAVELAGLKRYLEEYTLIKEREAIEVALFEEYLIYAQIMGIAKKVAKEFKDLYPEIIEQSNFSSYDNIIFIHTCSTHGISNARVQSYSAGGGGFSSGGGGGGSFGGGGGRWRFSLIEKIASKLILAIFVKIWSR